MIIENIKDFDLAQTLDCGQAFRWREQADGSFKGVAHRKLVTFRKDGESIAIDGASEEDFNKIWKNYLDLDLDYGTIKTELSKLHPTLSQAAEFAPGIRILNQEPWEALCSFIISQNNNIPRIKGIVERLCQNFGEQIEGDFYTFPSAEKIAGMTPEDLAPIRSGFRARYIIDGAVKVAGGEIDLEKALMEMMKRGKNVPGGACGFWGACGAGISSGMFVSIISSSTPLSVEPFALSHKMTAKSLNAIGEIGGPRCCKRDSYLSIQSAIDFVEEHFGVRMDKPKIVCQHAAQNNQCIGKRCPFNKASYKPEAGMK